MSQWRSLLLAVVVLSAANVRCTTGAPPPERPLPERLSETGLFVRGTEVVAADVLSYSPQYPLWSDGATKRRFIQLPKGASIDASDPNAWVFPVGTRFWKEFSFGERLETRTIERLRDGRFRYATYVWDAKLGDAILARERGSQVRGHDIPSRDDCRACHEGRRSPILGFGALQLSSDRDPEAPHGESSSPGALDLAELVRRGLVVGLPKAVTSRPPRIAAASPRARAAIGYLFGNCGHCHNHDGPLASLGLDLDSSVLDADGEARIAWGTMGHSSRYRVAGADAHLRIDAGRPDRSVLALRMRATDRASRMPPLGSRVVDDEAVRLVDDWIARSNSPIAHSNQGPRP